MLLLCLLTACASTPERVPAPELIERAEAADRAATEAEFEAERQRQEQLLVEERARDVAAREEAARQTEIAARAEAERQEQLQAQARQDAERQRQAEAQRTAERAQAVARQQARIAELREQIAANNAETANLESANATLREAIVAAEQLSAALTEEQQKYVDKDDTTGLPVNALSKTTLDELGAELDRLRAQAAALSRAAP
jgi:colicin import membrane protein